MTMRIVFRLMAQVAARHASHTSSAVTRESKWRTATTVFTRPPAVARPQRNTAAASVNREVLSFNTAKRVSMTMKSGQAVEDRGNTRGF
jgi:hypothetical protein